MANSATNIDQISSSQAAKEVTANAVIDAHSPSSAFGRRASTSTGLTWGYLGATLLVDGVLTQVGNGTIALTNAATNYIERDRAGAVSKNTTSFTAGLIPLYKAITSGSVVTSYTDYRSTPMRKIGKLVKAMPSDANYTLAAEESYNDILEFTGGTTLTAQRNIVVPLAAQTWIVFNNTTGAQNLQFIGASGTGIVVANGKRATIYSDATNVVRVTADT